MPKIKQIDRGGQKQILWHLQEDEAFFEHRLIDYKPFSKVIRKTSAKRRKEQLGIFMCLKELGLNHDLFYDDKGKPHLKNGPFISISHSKSWVIVGISKRPIGIDIEEKTQELLSISSRFLHPIEQEWIPKKQLQAYLPVLWCIKESLYKLYGEGLAAFNKQLWLPHFHLEENTSIYCFAQPKNKAKAKRHTAHYKTVGTLYWAWAY